MIDVVLVCFGIVTLLAFVALVLFLIATFIKCLYEDFWKGK